MVNEIVKCVEEFVPELNVLETQRTRFEDALASLNGKDSINYGGFIAPPVEDCTLCGTALTAPNALSSCTLFTMDGPKPCTKLSLRCQGASFLWSVDDAPQQWKCILLPRNYQKGNYPKEIIKVL